MGGEGTVKDTCETASAEHTFVRTLLAALEGIQDGFYSFP